jgi:hypothetical protein
MTRGTNTWTGRDVDRIRDLFATYLPSPCAVCDKQVLTKEDMRVGHILSRGSRPDLMWNLDNMRIECRRCSDGGGQRGVIEKAKSEAMRGEGGPPTPTPTKSARKIAAKRAVSGADGGVGNRRHSRALSPNVAIVPAFRPECLAGVPWLADLLDLPEDASWPRWMSPPHPQATGSYGLDLEIWLREEQGIEMRWWQKLATRRQLEHDADGELVWTTVVESCSRRVGKSSRLSAVATWRMAHPEVFSEPQTIIHTGSDLPVCREVQRRAWRWAEEKAGWTVTRANGKEAMETPSGDRWLVRAQNAVYGWDCSLGLCDEGWDVPPMVIDEGLEPATIERRMPQIVLTSTAHRRATSLMRRKIASALSGLGEDWETLLMVWGAPEDADISDPQVWKDASAHWTPQRAKMIGAKYDRAMRGESDPTDDDPDPIEAFRAQLLNIWPPLNAAKTSAGTSIINTADWDTLNGWLPTIGESPAVVALESWFTDGCSAVAAYRLPDGRVGVSAQSFGDVASAAAWASSLGAFNVLAGKSLLDDPAIVATGATGVGGTSRQAVTELKRFLDEGVLAHDGSDVLETQVLDVRISASPEGLRLRSTSRLDAVKAAVWAIGQARKGGVPMIW